MAASYLALPSSASEADREGAHASAHYGVYSSPQPPRATVRAARHGLQSLSDTPQSRLGAVVSICMRDATGLQSLSEIPQSRASRRPPSPRHSPRQRSSDHNHLRCTEDRRHCNARWRERGQAAPESADESESRERVRSGRVHESSFAYHRRLLSERFKSHFSPMTV